MSRLVVARPISVSGVHTFSSGSSGVLQFRINGSALSLVKQEIAEIGASSSGVVKAYETAVFGCSLVNGSRYALYKNGARVAGGATAQALSTNANIEFFSRSGGVSEPFTGTMFLHLEFQIELSAAEFSDLSLNPWQVFQ